MDSKYDAKKSKTYKNYNKTLPLFYGQGRAIGEVSSDSVNIADEQVKDQYFLSVIKDTDFDNLKADGILGMGPGYGGSAYPPLMYSMINQKIINESIFSVFLSPDDSDVNSCVLFGEVNLKKYAKKDSEIVYMKTLNDGYWSTRLNSITVKNTKIFQSSYSAILDTGTSLIMGPEHEINQVLKLIKKGNNCEYKDDYWFCDCDKTEDYPSIHINLSGNEFEIVPENYILKSSGKCRVLIKADKTLNMWILGDVFLRRYYTVYDLGNLRVGIVRSTNKDKVIENGSTWPRKLFWVSIFLIFLIFVYFIWGWIKEYRSRSRRRTAPLVDMTELVTR